MNGLFVMLTVLMAGPGVRTEALGLLQDGKPAHAEVLLLEQVEQGEQRHDDLLLVARVRQGDAAGALLSQLSVLDSMSDGAVSAGVVEAIVDREQWVVWSASPWLDAGPRRVQFIEALEATAPTSRRARGIRGALLSMFTGALHPDAHDAPTAWRDAALAMAGTPAQRSGARRRLERPGAPAVEQAWRLHVLGRSWLRESTAGSTRLGLVHFARLVAEEPMRSAHPRLALHALTELLADDSAVANDTLRRSYEALRRALEYTP
jgi:hypothetical protein